MKNARVYNIYIYTYIHKIETSKDTGKKVQSNPHPWIPIVVTSSHSILAFDSRSTQAYSSASTKTFIKSRACVCPVQITAHTLVGEKGRRKQWNSFKRPSLQESSSSIRSISIARRTNTGQIRGAFGKCESWSTINGDDTEARDRFEWRIDRNYGGLSSRRVKALTSRVIRLVRSAAAGVGGSERKRETEEIAALDAAQKWHVRRRN